MKETLYSLWIKNKKSYFLLLALLIGLIGVNLWKNGIGVTLTSLLGNLLSESIGIIIVVFFIDFFRQYSEERRIISIAKTGLGQLKVQYNRLMQLIKEQHKATSGVASVTTDFIFQNKDQVAASICTLNLQSPCPTNYGTTTPMNWEFHLKESTERFKKDLDMVVAQYVYFFPEETVQIIEKIKNDPLFEMFRVMSTIRTTSIQLGVPHQGLSWMSMFYIELLGNCEILKKELLKMGLENVE